MTSEGPSGQEKQQAQGGSVQPTLEGDGDGNGLAALRDEVREMREQLDQLLPHLLAQLKRDRGHDELVARLQQAERSREARKLWPAIASLHDALNEVRRYRSSDPQVTEVVIRELLGALDAAGFDEHGEPGEAFDPERHEAVEGRTMKGSGIVTEVLRPGLAIGSAAVTRASVIVAPTVDGDTEGDGT